MLVGLIALETLRDWRFAIVDAHGDDGGEYGRQRHRHATAGLRSRQNIPIRGSKKRKARCGGSNIYFIAGDRLDIRGADLIIC